MAAHPRADGAVGVEVAVADPLGHQPEPPPLAAGAGDAVAEVRHKDGRFGVADAAAGALRTVEAGARVVAVGVGGVAPAHITAT